MKTATVLLAGLMMLATGGVKAQPYFSPRSSHEKADLGKVVKYYLECLKSTNEGVIESGLAHVARMKLYYPERDFQALEKQVAVLTTEGPTAGLRYRAYLVGTLFTNPSQFAAISGSDYDGPEELFSAIARNLQTTLLGARESGRGS